MFGLGAIFSPIDERDYSIVKFSPQFLDKNDPVPEVRAVFRQQHVDNQGNSSCCSAYTMTNKLTVRTLQRTGDYVLFSPAAFYGDADNRTFKREGMTGRDTFQIARKTGALRREVFPIENGTYEQCAELYQSNKLSYKEQSIPYRIEGYARLYDPWEIAQYITQEQVPCWIAFDVYSNIANAERTGIIDLPSGTYLGGHAVLCHDLVYYRNTLYARFVNTWGKEWGDKGWGLLPASMIKEAWGDFDRPPLEAENSINEIVFFTKDINNTMNTKTIWTDSKNLKLSDHPDAYVDGSKIIIRNGVGATYVEGRLMVLARPVLEALGYQVDWMGDYIVVTKGKTESQFRKELNLE